MCSSARASSAWVSHRSMVLGALIGVLVGFVALAVVLPSSRAASRSPQASASHCAGGSQSLISLTAHAKLVSQTDVPVCVTGRVTVTFAADQATGCTAHGLCSYSGTDTWEPQGIGDLGVTTIAQDGHRSTSVTLVIGAVSTPVLSSVQRVGVGTSAAACSDHAQAEGGFFALSVHGGRVGVGLDHAQEPIFGTRCAGPLSADLAVALPHRTVGLARLRHGRLTINLSGSAPFAAGGFSGTVDSTVTLALGRPRIQPRHVTSPPGSTPTRITTVRYRITHLGGEAITTVRASGAAAVCGPLDACGLQGTIKVTPRGRSDGSVFLTASAPERRSKRDLLTALGLQSGGDTAGIFVDGAGETTGGAVAADLTQGGAACSNQVSLQQTEILLRKHADRLIVSVSPERSQAADPLRTRCPGPALGRHPLTSASLPLNILRRSRFTVRLHGDSFHDGPYNVTSRSTLIIGLQRRGVRTQILPFVSARTNG
jgi:hypothetical protein